MTRVIKSLTKNGSIGLSTFHINSMNGHRLAESIRYSFNLVLVVATIYRTIGKLFQWGRKEKELFFSCMDTAAVLLGMHSWQDSLLKMDMSFAESTN